MKTKKYKLLKNLFILATPVTIFATSVSCSNSGTKKQDPQNGSQTNGQQTDPGNSGQQGNTGNVGAGEGEGSANAEGQNQGQNPQTANSGSGTTTGTTTGTPSLSASSQQLKAEIQEISLYNDQFGKEVYEQYFKDLKNRKDSFVNPKYSKEQFEKDTERLAKYYSQVLELSEILKTKGDSEVNKYVDSIKSQSDSIFKVENGVTSVNVLEVNSLLSKLNTENAKTVRGKPNSIPGFISIGFGFGGRSSEFNNVAKEQTDADKAKLNK
ncbi:Uncharacterised protein [Mycoplasmopsis citelli]|uniref:Lipoprotein n=1 Tax=Mycoplasmopsis citelli TaxID=171281 RepID=A0A449B2Q5_9BACT|nr:hypothetical protein [Mycoplasmopsis citelli]VEU74863.1 Uncharacterised protein [Mycoplasmopsis citelli]